MARNSVLKFLGGKVERLFDTSTPVGPIHFFILPTLAYGIGFLFFPYSETVLKSSLHLTMVSLGDTLLSQVWGAALLLVFVGTMNTMLLKRWWIAHVSAFTGFLAWMFASLMYLQGSNVMLLFAVSIPNMLFWLWLYLRIKAGRTSFHLRP